jgi:Tol biopolymer transport system component
LAQEQSNAERIAVANGDGILVMRPDGSGRSVLATRPMIAGDVSLSRDARTASYASLSGIFLVDIDSRAARRVRTPAGLAIDPIFARRSSTLYFLHSRSATRVRYDLWSVAASGGRATRHTRGADLQMIDVSPDERRIAYVRDFSEAGGKLYVANRDGSGARLVARGFNPAFSPDGRLLAYSAFDGIRIVPVAGGKSRVVAPGGDHPVFSPGGKGLAFVDASRCIDHAYCLERVFVVPVGGGVARPVGPELANPGRFSWR